MLREVLRKIKIIFIPSEENQYRPKFLSGEVLFCCFLVLLILKLFTIPFFLYFPKTTFFASIVESDIIKLTNQERESLGLFPLRENPKLKQAALLKGQDMLKKGYFSHYSPEGKSPWYWIKLAGYNYQSAGENLAIGFLNSREVHHSWLASPSHQANILNPNYREIGVAVLKGNFQGNETTLVVQFFGSQPAPSAPQIKEIKQKLVTESIAKEQKKEELKSKPIIEEKLKSPTEKEILQPQEKSQEKPQEKKELILSAEDIKEKFGFGLFSFFASDYYQVIQKVTYAILILIIISLILNIFIRFDIQHPDLILKTLAFICLLILFILIDEITLLKFIPHQLKIYP